MIIESVKLRHVGPFLGVASIGSLGPGLNILADRNEIGKSTFVKAVTRVLFDRHTGRSEEIRELQPIGTSLAPTITVVFVQDNVRYRIEKRFLESPQSLLSEMTDGKPRPIADGDRADERLQALLGSQQPGRGATKPEHWGLFQYLWARQGEPACWPQWDGDNGERVRAHLVKIEIDPVIEHLKEVLEQQYGEIFTAQGRAKANGLLAGAESRLTDMVCNLKEVQAKSAEIASLETRYLTFKDEIVQLTEEARDKKLKAEEISSLARETELQLKELATLQQSFDSAQKDLHSITRDIQAVIDATKTIGNANTEINQITNTKQLLQENEVRLSGQLDTAEILLRDERENQEKAQLQLEQLQLLVKWRRAMGDLERLQNQLTDAESVVAQLDILEDRRSKVPALTAPKLKKLEGLQQRVNELTAKMQVIGISVEMTPESARVVEVTESGESRTLSIRAGATSSITSGQSLRLRLQDWGEVCVRSGAEELRELQDEHDAATQEIEAALTELGVSTVVDAAALFERRRELDAEIRETQRNLKRALGDYDAIGDLKNDVSQRSVRASNVEKGLRLGESEVSLPMSDIEAKEESLKVNLKTLDGNIHRISRERDGFTAELASCREEINKAKTELARLNERVLNSETSVKHVQDRYDGNMEGAKARAELLFTEAEARLKTLQNKIPPDAEKLPQRNKRAAAAAAEVDNELSKRKEDLNRIHWALEQHGSEGLYSRETELLEKIEVLKTEVLAIRNRGWAVRLLHDLVERRKQAATRAVLTPLQDGLSSHFADLTGDYVRKVFLDENLQITGVGRNRDELLQFGLLSQGAKEQLLLALRLSVATAVSDEQPQCLILDDVLVNTDPVRQERVLDILQSAAEDLQILVLTCHPDRYRGVGKSISIEYEGDQN